jgi:hypothetical protein
MLRHYSLSSILIVIGVGLIAIAFLSLSFSLVKGSLEFDGRYLDAVADSIYRRIYADRYFLQSIYLFLTGAILLVAGICRTENR